MGFRSVKPLFIAAFSLFLLLFSNNIFGQHGDPNPDGTKSEYPSENNDKKLKPAKIILEHVGDGHDYHFMTINGHPVTLALPVILYQEGRGFSIFMSSAFHHGEAVHEGYRLVNDEFLEEHHLNEKKDPKGKPLYQEGKIYAVDAQGMPVPDVKVYDFSMTRNVTQMLLSVILLIVIMTSIAKKYRKGYGTTSAPKGFQNAVEPVITFVRDEVAKPNLGHKYPAYMPLLLTIFFFILINNLIGLIPGSANVTGNIAFTAMLGLVSFIVIIFSSNKHFWGHIFNPPVPGGVKPIMIPVEILGIFTKPFALIIRLFANMISGHVIILSFIILIFIFGAMNTALGWGTSPFFLLLTVFIYLIEVLVAFIQAFIFANLTAVFIGQAFEGGHDHADVPGHNDPAVI
jgi:F-type H+-transporting ATPase subunit a